MDYYNKILILKKYFKQHIDNTDSDNANKTLLNIKTLHGKIIELILNLKDSNKDNKLDFTIKPFSLNDDMTESVFGSENVDNPLYQNIENLQKMEGSNPMTLLEDYQRQRNQQTQDQAKEKIKMQQSKSQFQNTTNTVDTNSMNMNNPMNNLNTITNLNNMNIFLLY